MRDRLLGALVVAVPVALLVAIVWWKGNPP